LDNIVSPCTSLRRFATHGWIGLALIALCWPANWLLEGPRTQLLFFPLWLGYVLTIDALVLMRKGTSLLTRSVKRFVGLFVVSAPAWWLFEALNWRVQNWHYVGRELFTNWQYILTASLSFSTVIPAVFGASELVSTFSFIQRMGRGPVIRPTPRTLVTFALSGVVMLALLLAFPRHFFPFTWLSLYFILEPINAALRFPSLANFTQQGDWRPIAALWMGALICGLFWECWNFFSFPKWVYTLPPIVNWGHIFEMPLLGYGGYLPFAMELYALYHLVTGLLRQSQPGYVQLTNDQ
jgi:hypothetical protein